MAYTFKALPTGKVEIYENGKAISNGVGFASSYASQLGYKPAVATAPVSNVSQSTLNSVSSAVANISNQVAKITPQVSALPKPNVSTSTPSVANINAAAPTNPKTTIATPINSGQVKTVANNTYKIASGETLSGIAAKNKTTVAALMAANPSIKNANLIYAGQSLTIPGATSGGATAPTNSANVPTAPIAPTISSNVPSMNDAGFNTALNEAESGGKTSFVYNGKPYGMVNGKWAVLTKENIQNREQAETIIGNGTAFGELSQDAYSDQMRKLGDPGVRTSSEIRQEIQDEIDKLINVQDPTPLKTQEQTLAESLTAPMGALGGKSINEINTAIAELDRQIDEQNAMAEAESTQYKVNVAGEEARKGITQNVFEGRLSEQAKNSNNKLSIINDRVTALTNQKKTMTAQLSVANDIVGKLMDARKTDYNTASDEYDKQYSQAIQLINMAQGIAESEQSDAEQAQTAARANAQIMYNQISAGTSDVADWSDSEKLTMQKLELSAGLPAGFYSTISVKNPNQDMKSLGTREDGGTKYADFLVTGVDGKIETVSYPLGNVDVASDKPTSTEQSAMTTAGADKVLKDNIGPGGFVDITVYRDLRAKYAAQGVSPATFDTYFSDYLSASDRSKYGIGTASGFNATGELNSGAGDDMSDLLKLLGG
jgi:LysM repeat protein